MDWQSYSVEFGINPEQRHRSANLHPMSSGARQSVGLDFAVGSVGPGHTAGGAVGYNEGIGDLPRLGQTGGKRCRGQATIPCP